MPDGISRDRFDLVTIVTQATQSFRYHPIDDLEISTAGEFLEFYESEIWLDAGCVAIHDQPNRAGRSDHRRLGIPVTVQFAKRQRAVPRLARGLNQLSVQAVFVIERDGRGREFFVTRGISMGGAAMVANHAQH